MRKIDLTGKRFGMLLVVKESIEKVNNLVTWECICDCGAKRGVGRNMLLSGKQRSCGCLGKLNRISNMKKSIASRTKPIGYEKVGVGGYIERKTVDGWKKAHVCVLEEFLGRKLDDGEVPHHCDEDKTNNTIENIELMLHGPHTGFHRSGKTTSQKTREKLSNSVRLTISQGRKSGVKLTPQKVKKIRLLLSSGLSCSQIAKKYNVAKSTIVHIGSRRTWSYI